LLRSIETFCLVFCFFLFLSKAYAQGKAELSLGYYNFSVTNSVTQVKAKVSGVGYYRLGYRLKVFDSLEVGGGYSLIQSSFISGDVGFGLDLNLVFFPLTQNYQIQHEDSDHIIKIIEIVRPFLGIGFQQRELQSKNSSLAANFGGISFFAGTEVSLKNTTFSLKPEIRYSMMAGPGSVSATETSFSLGLVLHH
jgi:hypothetical protein